MCRRHRLRGTLEIYAAAPLSGLKQFMQISFTLHGMESPHAPRHYIMKNIDKQKRSPLCMWSRCLWALLTVH